MAPVRGDGMRGLAVFISDIRNCKLTFTENPFLYVNNKTMIISHTSISNISNGVKCIDLFCVHNLVCTFGVVVLLLFLLVFMPF